MAWTTALRCVIGSALVNGLGATTLAAQSAASPLPIRDNSFLIEEAYNQERGVVQHVATFQRARGSSDWGATFTQEWPAPSERHQVGYTIPLVRTGGAGSIGVGDIALNYRYQVPLRARSRAALAPRASVMLPTGDEEEGRGEGSPGFELNVPASLELSRLLVTHVNAGARWGNGASVSDPSTVFVGQSLVLLIHPKFNLMVEALWTGELPDTGPIAGPDGHDAETFFIAPGFRGAFDFPSGLQIVPGVAFPIGLGRSDGESGLYLYLSLEHSFRRH